MVVGVSEQFDLTLTLGVGYRAVQGEEIVLSLDIVIQLR
jgi:ribosomal protein L6P/L9E